MWPSNNRRNRFQNPNNQTEQKASNENGESSASSSKKIFSPQGVCRFEMTLSGCRFGNSCKFRHEQPGSSNSKVNYNFKPTRQHEAADLNKMNHREWALSLGRPDSTSPPRVVSIATIALDFINAGDHNLQQTVIQNLGSDIGLKWIREILCKPFILKNSPTGVTKEPQLCRSNEYTFHTHCIPVLKVVTHEELMSSIALENTVGTIYNIIYGPSGIRGVGLIEQLVGHLTTLHTTTMVNPVEAFEEPAYLVCATLFHLVNLNQGSLAQPTLKALVERLANTMRNYGGQDQFYVRKALQQLQGLIQRFNIHTVVLGHKNLKAPAASKFILDLDPPGDLSPLGRRHNNDWAKIEKILILPTNNEITSPREPYVPYHITETHDHEGISTLLDANFRLLREDTSGLIRDALNSVIRQWLTIVSGDDAAAQKRAIRGIDLPINVFRNIQLEQILVGRGGLKFNVTFDQPNPALFEMKLKDRERWWEEARMLSRGSMLALMQNKKTIFFSVRERVVFMKQKKDPNDPDFDQNLGVPYGVFDLASDPQRAMIELELMETSEPDLPALLMDFVNGSHQDSVLVEFPRTLFASFEPVLQCLKDLHANPIVPFSQWLAPSQDTDFNHIDGELILAPPLYLTEGRNTYLDLTSITTDGHRIHHSNTSPVSIESLKRHTTLDNGQACSLAHAFRSELALIQGPPGTGKSYVGIQLAKVLLANAKKLKLGPILCVTYTNHALDQFLEHLLDAGEENIIRIGSQSKSERLKERMLSNIRRGIRRSKVEWGLINDCEADLQSLGEELLMCVERMRDANTAQNIQGFLEQMYPRISASFFDIASSEVNLDSDGFQEVHHHKYRIAKLYKMWIKNQSHPRRKRQVGIQSNRRIEELVNIYDPWDTTPSERRTLRAHWEGSIRDQLQNELRSLLKQHSERHRTFKRLQSETDRQCLSDARVIGVTSTALASKAALLRNVKCKVLIIEEAGEVLEAHTIISLIATIEHAILIGDHQQLRPQIGRYDLSMESSQGRKYALDMSLFERLAVHGVRGYKFPIAQLDIQRRMHPSVSKLIRNTLYPQLIDHESTTLYPDVYGMRDRLFWLDHIYKEDGIDESDQQKDTSKSNEWEADLCVALVQHLSRQGVYKKDEIAVLTPYLGQLRKLRNKFRDICDVSSISLDERDQADLENQDQLDSETGKTVEKGPRLHVQNIISGLRLATVDNFQGEEAKVIIISLVRSNPQRKIGFLRTSNRINVLLSRAQHGMYLIGNADTAEGIQMWGDVITMLRHENRVGRVLELQCPRHPDTQISVASPDDFNKLAPEGGCSSRCDRRLDCGHACVVKCHADYLHKSVSCFQDCLRTFSHCDHPCPKRCWEKCGNCVVPITSNITLPCGHTPKSVRCFETVDLSKVRCYHEVARLVEKCQHEAVVHCHTNMATYQCRKMCESLLPCGHICLRSCWECHSTDTVTHGPCQTPCGRLFTTCNHTCRTICHDGTPCGACKQKCEIRCAHSKCNKKCAEACAPCAEECTTGCVHQGKCKMPCAVPCDVLPCKIRCETVLECGHQCPSICGEHCPEPAEGCQVCAHPDVLDKKVDLITMETLREVNVDEEPLIFLPCKHIYTVSTLDGHMGMNDVYQMDSAGKIIGPKPFSKVLVKNCPECRYPLRELHRYNRIVKAALIDQATKRFMSSAAVQLQEYLKKVEEWENVVRILVDMFVARRGSTRGMDISFFERYMEENMKRLSELAKFQKSVSKKEQPYARVSTLVQATRRLNETSSTYEVDGSEIQHGFSMKAAALQLRFVWAVAYNHIRALKDIKDQEDTQHVFENQWCNILYPLLNRYRQVANDLIANAMAGTFIYQELEGRIYRAMFTGLMYRNVLPNKTPEDIAQEKELEIASLSECEAKMRPSTKSLQEDLRQAWNFLRDSTFYTVVSNEEKSAVYAAMAAEFRGTGHWYYCENNHPFTIGECGMAMELARCPECGAPVGGQHHRSVEGVRRADDMERQFGAMAI